MHVIALPQKYQSWVKPRCLLFREMEKTYQIDADTCLTCKSGRLLCGKPKCPLLTQLQPKRLNLRLKRIMFGPSPPAIFVGWHGYPRILAGSLVVHDPDSNQTPSFYGNPRKWYGLPLETIAYYRTSLVRGYTKVKARARVNGKLFEKSQEVTQSINPVDIEMQFTKTPRMGVVYSAVAQPMGPSAQLKRLDLADNPKIPKKISYLTEGDVSATAAVTELFNARFEIYYIQNLFSAGVLGLTPKKRIVPTRWAITAVDDILGRYLIREIKKYPSINEFSIYFNEYAGNHLEILFIPDVWEYEQLETWTPGTLWTGGAKVPIIIQSYEPYTGLIDYALKEGGGFYGIRFAVVEALQKMKRQAAALVIREISEEYYLPVGVWLPRENARHALAKPPRKFTTLEEALRNIQSRLTIPLTEWVRGSTLLPKVQQQKKLIDFLPKNE
ncbi:MAG: hypothetical protein ACE5R6_18415 [Candidatus Heimdallarchaeota archaeon]